MKLQPLLILGVVSRAQANNPFGSELEIDGGSTLDSLSHSENIDAQIRDLTRNAQQNPNATRGVAFKPFQGIDTSNSALSSGDAEWTWRVNVSDFAVPSAKEYNEVVDPHIVATTYDFTWPGGGNLSAALGDPRAGLCLSFVSLPLDFPANVTDGYSNDNANDPSCVPMLGQSCVDAILTSGRTAVGQPFGLCTAGSAWFELPECKSTLGYVLSTAGSAGTNTISLGFQNSSNATHDRENGEGWYGLFSAPQNGGASVEYYNATNRVHIAMIDPVLPSTRDTGYAEGAKLLCMRVNVTDEDTGEDTKEDLGSSIKQSAASALFVACLTSLAFMFLA